MGAHRDRIATLSQPVSDAPEGVPLLYEGDAFTLSQGEAAWSPTIAPLEMTRRVLGNSGEGKSFYALPSLDSDVEAVPGIWDRLNTECMICVVNQDAFDVVVEPGHRFGEVVEAVLQTKVCQGCGQQDTRAWFPKRVIQFATNMEPTSRRPQFHASRLRLEPRIK